jgi:hypothetical protein
LSKMFQPEHGIRAAHESLSWHEADQANATRMSAAAKADVASFWQRSGITSDAPLVTRTLRLAGDLGGQHQADHPFHQPEKHRSRYRTSGQPFVTTGGGALPLPTQPTIPTATKVASSATKSFFMLTPSSSEGAKIRGQNQA